MDQTPTPLSGTKPPILLVGCLLLLAGLVASAGTALALLALASAVRAGVFTLGEIAWVVSSFLGGLAAGGLLWAAAHVVGRHARALLLQEKLLASLRQVELPVLPFAEGPSGEQPPRIGPAGDDQQQLLQEIRSLLLDLNENLLLSPAERQARLKHRREKLSRELAERVEQAIAAAEFDRAEKQLEQFVDRLPEDPAPHRLRERLVETRQAAKVEDIAATTRQADDLMAVSSFDRAEAAARELTERYPDEPEPTALLDRVRREGKKFTDEQRDRMYHEFQRRAAARQWRAALDAAHQFIDAFGETADAKAVQAMIPTIQDNARIEEVRELRDRIRDLIERRRYAEAVQFAEQVIRRFPKTRAAAELSRQLARLKELSRTAPGNQPPTP